MTWCAVWWLGVDVWMTDDGGCVIAFNGCDYRPAVGPSEFPAYLIWKWRIREI